MPTYKLKYFNSRGAAEISRLLFALADQKYEDVRFLPEEWTKEKPNAVFKQMPVLEIDGSTYSQSIAITRYLAKTFGLFGSNNIEFLKIEQVLGIIADLVQAIVKLFYEKDEVKKAEHLKDTKERIFPLHLGTLERLLKEEGTGFFAGGKITLADVSMFDLIAKIGQYVEPIVGFPLLKKNTEVVAANPKIAKWLKARPVTEN